MDPYIDPEALDPAHPLTPRKLDNLARADGAHRRHAVHVDALPCKVTFQTTDVCNLDCPHCQIPRAQKTDAMRPELLGWLREQRLSLARQLLAQTDTPIADIAQHCGYTSPANFATAFRERFEATPDSYD